MSDIDILGTLAPNAGSTAPLTRAEYIRGSVLVVDDATARDAIPAALLRNKQIALLASTGSWYQWNGSSWGVYAGFGSSIVDWKDSVRVATTANITLSGAQTINGVAVVAGDRVLVKNQSTGSQNGLYVAASGAWARSADADTSAEVTSGMGVVATEGAGDKLFLLTTADPIVLGTTALTFTQLSSATGDEVNIHSSGGVLSLIAASVTNSQLAGSIAWPKLLTAIGNLGFTGLKSLSYNGEIDNNNSSTADTIDWSAGSLQKSTLTGNCTFTFSNLVAGTDYRLKLIQDGTGGRTVTWPTVSWVGGAAPLLSTAAGAVDFISFYYDGTTLWGSVASGLSSSLSVGPLPATAGSFRGPNGGSLQFRNTGNTGNIVAFASSGNDIEIGASANASNINAILGTSSTFNVVFGATVKLQVGNTAVAIVPPDLHFDPLSSNPVFYVNDRGTNAITGTLFWMHGQNCTGTTTTGGSVKLSAGTGTTVAGSVYVTTSGGTKRIEANDTGIGFFAATPVSQRTLTDSTGGTPATSLVDVGATHDQAKLNNNFASIRQLLNQYGLAA